MTDGITVTPKSPSVAPSQSYTSDSVTPIAGFLGLDTHAINDVDSQSLQKIYDFVRGDAKEMTELEMLHKVRELEQRLGMTSLGERRVDKVFRYVKLQSQIDHLSQARDRELR